MRKKFIVELETINSGDGDLVGLLVNIDGDNCTLSEIYGLIIYLCGIWANTAQSINEPVPPEIAAFVAQERSIPGVKH